MNPMTHPLRQFMPQMMQRQTPMVSQNPFQRFGEMMAAMRNPMAFVKQKFPDIPDQILNDPNQVLRYMQQNCGVTDQDIQMAASQIPRY